VIKSFLMVETQLLVAAQTDQNIDSLDPPDEGSRTPDIAVEGTNGKNASDELEEVAADAEGEQTFAATSDVDVGYPEPGLSESSTKNSSPTSLETTSSSAVLVSLESSLEEKNTSIESLVVSSDEDPISLKAAEEESTPIEVTEVDSASVGQSISREAPEEEEPISLEASEEESISLEASEESVSLELDSLETSEEENLDSLEATCGDVSSTEKSLSSECLPFKMTDSRRRVKLYELNAEKQWDDKGTGHVSTVYVEKLKGISLVVRAESDGSILLESRIHEDTAYQKQQETLIVWNEGEKNDLAISFQEKAGCEDTWEKICNVQGKDPTLDYTQDPEEESENMSDMDRTFDTVLPIELPTVGVATLKEISELIGGCLQSPIRKERLAVAIENDMYIKKLLEIFHVCEDTANAAGLHYLNEIFKNIFMLNKNSLFELMFADDTIFDVVGCFDYGTQRVPKPKGHRTYLKNVAQFHQVIPITNTELISKIHQTYRVQYIQDVVLPTPSIFEENMLSTLSSFIFFNKVEIVSLIQEDETFLTDLFNQLKEPHTPECKRKDLVLFLKEFCHFSQTLQPQSRESFYKTLSTLGVLSALSMTLQSPVKETKAASVDVLLFIVDFSPSLVREFMMHQQVKDNKDEERLMNIVIRCMISDLDMDEAVPLMGIIRTLLDPENMIASVNKSEKTDFLNHFYKHCMQVMASPILNNEMNEAEGNGGIQLKGLVLEVLSFCVEHHTYHIKNYILQKDLLKRVLVHLNSKQTFLKVCSVRFMRRIVGLKDEFYNRYIVKGNLFAPLVEALLENKAKYNLLDSAILEMFEFIKTEDVKSLLDHVVENFGDTLDSVTYVQTFVQLKAVYDQHQGRMRERSSVNYIEQNSDDDDFDAIGDSIVPIGKIMEEDKKRELGGVGGGNTSKKSPTKKPLKRLGPLVDYDDDSDEDEEELLSPKKRLLDSDLPPSKRFKT